MRSVLFFTLLLCSISCKKQEVVEPVRLDIKSYPGVEKVFWSHFSAFEDEASRRGITVDLTSAGITGKIGNTLGPEVGHCNFDSNQPSSITIDSVVWYGATDLAHESIVFHELGHCYLGRGHDNSANPLGECISIMNTGNHKYCNFIYTEENREAYLNELFQ